MTVHNAPQAGRLRVAWMVERRDLGWRANHGTAALRFEAQRRERAEYNTYVHYSRRGGTASGAGCRKGASSLPPLCRPCRFTHLGYRQNLFDGAILSGVQARHARRP